MTEVFADTSFFVALMSRRDGAHAAALRSLELISGNIVTSQWVVVETANFFSRASLRPLGIQFLESVFHAGAIGVLSASEADERAAIKLYMERADKEWSLTDCHSMVLMRQHGIIDVLTSDHHFIQAGFNALLTPNQ